MKFVPINGPIVANTVYSDDKLVARDVAITLPEVAPLTADLSVMGTYTVPVWQLIDAMEAAITKIGIDLGLRSLLTPESKPLEARWVQTVTDANGTTKNVGCKAFLRGIPNKLPEIGQEIGSASEQECTLAISRYQLVVDGVEMWLIDRFAGIVRIAGKDVSKLDNLL